MRLAPALVASLALAAASGAATIQVNPGPGALQGAIDAATPGDTLRVHAGTYSEAVSVTKALRIVGDGAGVVIVDGGCAAPAALAIEADGVFVRSIQVKRGTVFAIDVENRDRVTIRDVQVFEGCGEEYGINVYQSSRVRLLGNFAGGFADAGIYIGGIAADANVRALRNSTTGNVRGIIVEDSLPPVIVTRNGVGDNTADGILVHNSDGVRLLRNIVYSNDGNGVVLDATSDENLLRANQISGSGGLDVVDDGASNCWIANTYGTGTPNPGGC